MRSTIKASLKGGRCRAKSASEPAARRSVRSPSEAHSRAKGKRLHNAKSAAARPKTIAKRRCAGRAPSGHSLTRTMVGGARRRDLAGQDDAALLDVVRKELRAALGANKDPAFTQVIRWPRAIPQYVVGHGARVDGIDARVADWPGFFLTGNAFKGVSLADCVSNARVTAQAVLDA